MKKSRGEKISQKSRFFLLLLNKKSRKLNVTKIRKWKFSGNFRSRTGWNISCFISCQTVHAFFYKQLSYKQHQVEIGKKASKC